MARHFDEELIRQIRNANDIVSVISEYVTLKKKGKNYWGCCPFHNEKTPSFSVNPDKNIFHCFGCKASGDAIGFIMKQDNLTFPEALTKLAERAQIVLPEIKKSAKEIAQEKMMAQVYEVNELATRFFHSCLVNTSMGKRALDYLYNRGLTRESIEEFRLGFAPDSWNRLKEALNKRGFSDEVLYEAGLCRQKDGRYYDYFRNRIMFPISDGRGRVVAFGGRVMDHQEPKYLNSSDAKHFNKGRLLFAFYQAYKEIRRTKQVIIVEGYMDVIAGHTKGIKNMVASLGTAFTSQQSQLLMRQAEEIILAYDMDVAGRQAAQRAMELLENTEFKVRILSMPQGKDPDEFLKSHTKEEFLQLVAEAVTPFDYLLKESLLHHTINTMEEKLAVLNEIFPYIHRIDNKLKQEGYLKSLALTLYLDTSTIIKYFRDFKKNGHIEEKNEFISTVYSVKNTLEDIVAHIAIVNPTFLHEIMSYVKEDEHANPVIMCILTKAKQLLADKLYVDTESIVPYLDEEEKNELYRLLMLDIDMDIEKIPNYIRNYRYDLLQRMFKYHSVKADAMSRSNDPHFIEELRVCQYIQKEMQKWSK